MSESLDDGSDFDEVFRVLLPRGVRGAYRILGDVHETEGAAVETLARAPLSARISGSGWPCPAT